MAETNITGPLWGYEYRSRRLAGLWPTSVYAPILGQKAIFGYGVNLSIGTLSMTSLVSNTGVVGNDVTGVGTARANLAAAGYGGDKAIFGFGGGSITNLVSNTGVVASDTAGVGTVRSALAAASYGS